MFLEWDHDQAGEAEAPTWAREQSMGPLCRPLPGQLGPATRRAVRATRVAKALVWVVVLGVVGVVALTLWAGPWRR